jgi:PST family polysaccharide transporter
MQEHPEGIGQAVEKMLRYLMLTTVPTLAVGAALIPQIIHFVFTNKWEPATVAFYLLTVRMLGGNITTPFIGVLNARGRVKTSLQILSLWTIVDWGLALAFTRVLGFNGVAAAYAVGIGLPVVWLLWEFRRIAPLDLKYAIGHPVAAGIIAGALTWAAGRVWVTGLFSLAAVMLLGLALYPLAMIILERKRFVREIQTEARLVKTAFISKLEETR